MARALGLVVCTAAIVPSLLLGVMVLFALHQPPPPAVDCGLALASPVFLVAAWAMLAVGALAVPGVLALCCMGTREDVFGRFTRGSLQLHAALVACGALTLLYGSLL